MRAAQLDHEITIERVSTASSDSGAVTETWSPVVTLRAQIVQEETGIQSVQREHGASTEIAILFRTRFFADITALDRVSYRGFPYRIEEIKNLPGRNRGLELRCKWVGP